ncbi:MAG: hypothetical protein U9N81_03880 [Bacillota bacterium]|nr:hypothetical protein [Bacillota bacterium]
MNRPLSPQKENRIRVYTQHQAFEQVYQQLLQDPSPCASQREAPLQHHHCPDKLIQFKDARAYFSWGVELYKHGQQLLHALGEVTRGTYKAQNKLELKALLQNIERQITGGRNNTLFFRKKRHPATE